MSTDRYIGAVDRWDCLKVGKVCQQNESVQGEFQVDGAETENAREEKLLITPEGLAKRFELEECNHLYGSWWQISLERLAS